MIQSFYFICSSGEALIEKHWRGVCPRCIIQHFWSLATACKNKDEVPPVIEFMKHYIFSIHRNGNFLVAVVLQETAPLLVIEFLNRVNDIFKEYFGDTDENSIKDNFSTVYQLLEEMMDFGYPLITEPNVLGSMVKPPSVLSRFTSAATGASSNISDELPDGTISNIPWRKTGVKYTQNEIFVDIIEEIDAIIDSRGAIVSSEVSGVLLTNCRLSGMPDVTVTFKDPDVIDDCSFHACVRYNRFDRDRVLSFVPPDGVFELMKYRVNKRTNVLAAPIFASPQIKIDTNTGKGTLTIHIGNRPHSSLIPTKKMSGNIIVEELVLQIPFSKSLLPKNLHTDCGTVLFDESAKILKWNVGSLPNKEPVTMTGNLEISGTKNSGEMNDYNKDIQISDVQLQWKVTNASFSGLSLSSLQITNEVYKPFKGVRSIAKSGKFQIRTG